MERREIILGQIIHMQCTQCGFQKDIYIGGGLRDCELQTIFSVLPADEQHILAKAVDEGASQISVTRMLCSCNFCKELYALPIVSYVLNDTEQELYGSCPRCNARGVDKREENTIFLCPECGEKVKHLQVGHWD